MTGLKDRAGVLSAVEKGLLFGDIVGGPLRGVFGNGIGDLAVRSQGLIRNLTLLAHVSYWREGPSGKDPKNATALSVLTEVLDLNGERLGIARLERRSNFSRSLDKEEHKR